MRGNGAGANLNLKEGLKAEELLKKAQDTHKPSSLEPRKWRPTQISPQCRLRRPAVSYANPLFPEPIVVRSEQKIIEKFIVKEMSERWNKQFRFIGIRFRPGII